MHHHLLRRTSFPPAEETAATQEETSRSGPAALRGRVTTWIGVFPTPEQALLSHCCLQALWRPRWSSLGPNQEYHQPLLSTQPSWSRLSLPTFSLSFSSLNAEYSAVCRCSLSTRLSRSSRIFSSKVCCWFTRSVTRLEGHKVKADRINSTGCEQPGTWYGVGPSVPTQVTHVSLLGTLPAPQSPPRGAAALPLLPVAFPGIPLRINSLLRFVSHTTPSKKPSLFWSSREAETLPEDNGQKSQSLPSSPRHPLDLLTY